MPIKKDDVRYIAKLSRLKLKNEEIEYFADQLGAILDYIDLLKEVDVKGVEPTSHVLSLKNVYRKDVPAASLKTQSVLGNAPSREDNYFKVTRIIEDA
ncbi:MAG: Asp-tRNA(Asn)/Glu-tRNA(Gln) amidotransferase subunit GatC [Candidatus Omnitrophica bacterium]|nr:Asp-tRNA(Asn)/Glu-tRNA(Gln) amidotransferase subunit GatC [Candidatus Omnitrophota bacterium]